MFNLIKKADIVLFIVLVIAGIIMAVFSLSGATDGAIVKVSVNGSEYGSYSLAENQTIEIKENGHINKIIIKDGFASMDYSDCKNQICVRDGKISKSNQTLVCLPNKVMVEITGGEEEFDAVAN